MPLQTLIPLKIVPFNNVMPNSLAGKANPQPMRGFDRVKRSGINRMEELLMDEVIP
jgi:hypothetical protein